MEEIEYKVRIKTTGKPEVVNYEFQRAVRTDFPDADIAQIVRHDPLTVRDVTNAKPWRQPE